MLESKEHRSSIFIEKSRLNNVKSAISIEKQAFLSFSIFRKKNLTKNKETKKDDSSTREENSRNFDLMTRI